MVNWEVVCLPKSERGFRLRKVKEFNEACTLKFGRSAVSSGFLWASWF